MFDDDEFLERPPSRWRLWILLSALALVIGAAGAVLWWLYRPQPQTPQVVRYDPVQIGRAEMEAKKLPEYAEVGGRMITRPANDAEITRLIELSQHSNAWIRLIARARLAKVTDGPRRADAVSAVAAGLHEESLLMRVDAMAHLGSMKTRECAAELRGFLASEDEDERKCARRALQQMGLPVE